MKILILRYKLNIEEKGNQPTFEQIRDCKCGLLSLGDWLMNDDRRAAGQMEWKIGTNQTLFVTLCTLVLLCLFFQRKK